MNSVDHSCLPHGQSWLAHRNFRSATRKVLQNALDASLHIERLETALLVTGVEPAQGSLADALFSLEHELPTIVNSAVFARVVEQLPCHIGSAFSRLAGAGEVEALDKNRLSLLATRWSVLATPSSKLPARARRASSDEAKLMAQNLVLAMEKQGVEDHDAQTSFLAHCLACRDKLAFMLARRELLRRGVFTQLPQAWQDVAEKLEN